MQSLLAQIETEHVGIEGVMILGYKRCGQHHSANRAVKKTYRLRGRFLEYETDRTLRPYAREEAGSTERKGGRRREKRALGLQPPSPPLYSHVRSWVTP